MVKRCMSVHQMGEMRMFWGNRCIHLIHSQCKIQLSAIFLTFLCIYTPHNGDVKNGESLPPGTFQKLLTQ